MKSTLQKIIDYGLLATLIIFPLSIKIALISPDDWVHPIIAIQLSLADIFIGLLLILWGIKVVIYKELKRIKIPPSSILVFVGVVCISFVNASSLSVWVKEFIQIIEYFVLFYLLLLNNLKSVKTETIFLTIYISTSILLLISFFQHTILNADTYLVRGFFENRNFLGAYLCITIPLVFSDYLQSTSKIIKVWMAAILALSFWVLLSGSAIVVLIISLGIISWKYGKKTRIRYCIILITFLSIYPFIFPDKNVEACKEFLSVYESGSINDNYYRRLTLLGDKGENILLRRELGANYLQVTCEKFFNPSLPEPIKGNRYKSMEDIKHIKNLYIEMQASLNLVSEHSLMGVGAGNFQQHIGNSYNNLPKINTSEPGIHNGFLVTASTLGILGLATLFWLFFSMLKESIYNYAHGNNTYALGLLGSIVACLAQNLFVYMFTAQLMVPVVYLVFLSISSRNNGYASI